MKRSLSLLLLPLLLSLQACAVGELGRYPNLVSDESSAVMLNGVELVYEDRTRRKRENSGRLYDSFMRTANNENGTGVALSEGSPYRLRVAAKWQYGGRPWLVIDFLFFVLLLPAVVTDAAILEGELSRDGVVLGTFEASGGVKTYYWLPLLPFFPIAIYNQPDQEKVLDDTYRDLYIAVSRDLDTR
jgi:hypothetical protein